jgi:hypothetical protein
MSVDVVQRRRLRGVCRRHNWHQRWWSSTRLVDKNRCGWAMMWPRSVHGVGAVVVVNLTLARPNVGNGQGLHDE